MRGDKDRFTGHLSIILSEEDVTILVEVADNIFAIDLIVVEV